MAKKKVLEEVSNEWVIGKIINYEYECLGGILYFSNLDDIDVRNGEEYGLVTDEYDWGNRTLDHLRQLSFYKVITEEG